jgi:hypothetical protein
VAYDTRSVPGPPGQPSPQHFREQRRDLQGVIRCCPEFVQNAGIVALLLGLVLLFVMLVLGMIIVIRARKEDLPEVVHGLAEWFRRSRK